MIDSLRPLEVRNVYNGVQIKIIVLQNELGLEQKNVPEFEEIFDDEEEDTESQDETDEGHCEEEIEANEIFYSDEEDITNSKSINSKNTKKKRFDPDILEKRHKKREWEEKR